MDAASPSTTPTESATSASTTGPVTNSSLVLEAKAALRFEKELIVDDFASTAVDSILYDTDSKQLTVKFASGAVYSYSEVPRYTVTMLRNAKSQGQFFHKYVRPRYEFQRESKDYSGPHGSEDGEPDWGGSGPRDGASDSNDIRDQVRNSFATVERQHGITRALNTLGFLAKKIHDTEFYDLYNSLANDRRGPYEKDAMIETLSALMERHPNSPLFSNLRSLRHQPPRSTSKPPTQRDMPWWSEKGGPGSGYHGDRPSENDSDWGGSASRDGPARPPGVRMGRRVFKGADMKTLKGFLQEQQKEYALREFLKATDGAMSIIDEGALHANIRNPAVNGKLSRREFIDQVVEGFQQTLKEPLPFIDEADDISEAEHELAETFAENIAYAHAGRLYDRIKARTGSDLVGKGEACDDCGGKTVGFLGDAFLCQECMDKATYPIKWGG